MSVNEDDSTVIIKSCGAVLFTYINNVRHYVLVNSLDGRYGLPKGRMEAGESEKETALREVFEETGIHAEIVDGFRRKIKYIMPRGDKKIVILFAAQYTNQELKFDPLEHSGIIAAPIKEALSTLSWDDMKEVLLEADEFLDSL